MEGETTGAPQNVVLVTADSLRADHCGFLNAASDLTPTLDALAEEGVVFENAIAPGPRTPTSVPETLTGEPMVHAAADSYGEQVSRIADHLDRRATLPERLGEAGYETVAYSANPWMSACGLDEKFDEFRDIGSMEPSRLADASSSLFGDTQAETVALWFERWRQKRSFFSQWPAFFDELAETVRSLPEPYFVWVFLLDTHNPYIVPRRDRVESSTAGMYYGLIRGNAIISHSSDGTTFKSEVPPHVETYVKRAYRDGVRSVDRFVSKLLALTRDDDPLVAFHADHGEAFGEHGTYGHQQALYEENVHVPLLVSGGAGDEPRRVSRPVSLRTLPDMLVSAATEGTPVGSDEWTEEYVVARSEDGSKIAVRGEDSKYIRSPDTEELYDLAADPGERRNLAADADAAPFRRRIEAYLETVPRPEAASPTADVSDEVQRRLSMLGYDE